MFSKSIAFFISFSWTLLFLSTTKIILSLDLKIAVFPIYSLECSAASILKNGSFILPLNHNLLFLSINPNSPVL